MEVVVLSGKGGTGKTTIATALCELAEDVVKVDCDVDAPNLYLFYKGIDIKKEDFYSGNKALIDYDICNSCGKCEEYCEFGAINNNKINSYICEGCGACVIVCPQKAIKLEEEKGAETYITETNKGIISRAEMDIGSEGSGKLISKLKRNSKNYTNDNTITILDGSPGIGCSVISSITGSNIALIVTEPTRSGMEDLERVVSLCEHFKIKILICINKFDINLDISNKIKKFCIDKKLNIVGEIPYDDLVVKSINELRPIVEYSESIANIEIRKMWLKIKNIIKKE